MIQAKIIADSLSLQGERLTTFVVTFPRMILAEFNTHRLFSRNSASSRAIPFEKMVKSVEENPFIPIAWQKHHKGMQGSEYINDEYEIESCKLNWLQAKHSAIFHATELDRIGITKQLCNRLLEPFMWHTVIITSGKEGLENFFNLRCPEYTFNGIDLSGTFKSKKDVLSTSKKGSISENLLLNYTDLDWLKINKGQSEIHIQALAELMYDAYNESKPKELKAEEWHIPFGENIKPINNWGEILESVKIKIATARCARVSYTVVGEEDKESNYENDIKLHDRLLESGHFSPFEHCAKVMTDDEYESFVKAKLKFIDEIEWYTIEEPLYKEKGWCNNFKGFIQYRYMIENK